MELSQAKQIINSAIDIAIQKGCYSLVDAQTLIHALEKINSMDDIEFAESPELIKE